MQTFSDDDSHQATKPDDDYAHVIAAPSTLSLHVRKRLDQGGKHHVSDDNGPPSDGQDGRDFLLDVSFEAPPGVTILFGASGAGKSMTLRCVAGVARPDEGLIAVGDEVFFDSRRGINHPARRRGVGYVFQSLALFPNLTAQGNVEFALAHLSKQERARAAREALENFGVGHAADRRPRAISGGEAQRVALARALASRPRLLLLDEPLSALDEPTKRGIVADLRRLNERLRLPVLYVTHSRDEALSLGERVVVLERGRVAATGEPAEVFGTPTREHIARLTGVENLFSCRVVSRDESAGTMSVAVSQVEGADEGRETCLLDVPLGGALVGETLKVGVRAGDVLLAVGGPGRTSARNVMQGRLESLEEDGSRLLARVRCGGVRWSVLLTRGAARDLSLAPGLEVWLLVKTHSCHLLAK